MNELPPSPGPGTRGSPEPVQKPSEPDAQEALTGAWQGKQVESSAPTEPPPLDESKVPTSPIRKKSPSREKGAHANGDKKPKSPTRKTADGQEPLSFERFQEAFNSLEFPAMSGYEHYFEKVLVLLTERFKGMGDSRAKRAHVLFHKALILKRMGSADHEVKAVLNLAWQFDPSVTFKQYSLALALSRLGQKKTDISYNALIASMNRLRPACSEQPAGSLMARLKLAQTVLGIYERPGLELFRSPYLLPDYYQMISVMAEPPDVPVVEATFSNGLELSFLLKEELFSQEEMSDLELAVSEILWIAQYAKDAYSKKMTPKHWCKHLTPTRYLDLTKVWISTTFRNKEKLEENLSDANLAKMRSSISDLSDMSLGPSVSYMRAFVAMVLGRCIETGIYEKPVKSCADYFAIAAQHPAFVSLYPRAAEHYQAALCYKEATQQMKQYLLKALLQDGDRDTAMEKLEEIEELAHQQEQFLRQSVSPTVPVEIVDEKVDTDQPAKTKKKKGRSSKKNNKVKAKKASEKNVQSKETRVQSPPPEPAESGKYHEARAMSPLGQEETEEPVQFWWNKDALQSMNRFYEARAAGNRTEEVTHLHEAAAKVKSPAEQFSVHYQAAWHYLGQVKLLPKFRTILHKGQPASIDYLCQTGRKHLAKCFSGLTSVHVVATVSPDDMGKSLDRCLPPRGMNQEQEDRYREQLRMLMSSFGHSYSYQADYAPGNRELGKYTRGFYGLKKVAKPFYSKKTKVLGVQSEGIQLLSREEFERLRSGRGAS